MDKNSLALLLSFICSSFFFLKVLISKEKRFFSKRPEFFLHAMKKWKMKKSLPNKIWFYPDAALPAPQVNPQNYKDMYSFSTFSSFTGKSLTGPSNGTCSKVHVLVKLFLIYLYVFSSILLARRGCQGRSFHLT